MTMNRTTSLVIAMVALVSAARFVTADEPDAVLDQHGGTFGIGVIDAAPDQAGQDQIWTTSTRENIKATYAFAWQTNWDGLEITVHPANIGQRINSATADGRDPNEDVLYVVVGVFVHTPTAGGDDGTWEADYSKGLAIRLYMEMNAPDDATDNLVGLNGTQDMIVGVRIGSNPTEYLELMDKQWSVDLTDTDGPGTATFAPSSVQLGCQGDRFITFQEVSVGGAAMGATTMTATTSASSSTQMSPASKTAYVIKVTILCGLASYAACESA